LFLNLNPAAAFFNPITWITSKAVGIVTYTTTYIIGFILQGITTLLGLAINHALTLSANLLNEHIVTEGWRIVRDFANLFLVLIIIVIAFGTILRIPAYGIKKTLAKLIIVAFLVNFSLLFAGTILDFSNLLTYYFLNHATNGRGLALATALQNTFQPQRLFEVKSFGETETGQDFANILQNLGNLAFVLIFSLVVVFIFMVLGILLYIRVISLAILLVLAPIAWICWILPITAQHWEKWWNQFLRWCLFTPVASFFIYLSFSYLTVRSIKNSTRLELMNSTDLVGTLNTASNTPDFSTVAIQMILITGLMIGGLIAANSLGISGARFFYNAGGRLAKNLGGAVAAGGKRFILAPTVGRGLEQMKKAGYGRGRFLRAVGGIVRAPAETLSRRGYGFKTARYQEFKKAEQQIKTMPWEMIKASAPGYILPGKKLAALERGIAEGKILDLPPSMLAEAPRLYQSAGMDPGKLYNALPTLKPEVNRALQKKDFAEAGRQLAVTIPRMKDYKSLNLGPILEGHPSIRGSLTPAEWKNNIVPRVNRAILVDKAAGRKIGDAIEKLNRKQRDLFKEEFIKVIPGKTPEQKITWLKSFNPSLYTYLTSSAAHKAGVKLPEAKEKK